MNNKILITGSTGFVGKYIVDQAFQKGYDIHLIVRNRQKAKNIFGQRVKFYEINDLTKKNQLREILEKVKPEYVIHLVGIIKEAKNKGITFERVHFEYSRSLYEVLKDFSPKKVIHMSALGVDENAPSKYHITKFKAEKELIKSGIPYVILRPSFILGPEQLLFAKLKPLLKKLPVLIFPDILGYFFQPVDVRDVAECFIKGFDYNGNGIFQLCGDEKVSLKEIVRDFAKHNGKKTIFIPIPKLILKILASKQYKMMWRNNICNNSDESLPIQKLLGREPIPYNESIKWSSIT